MTTDSEDIWIVERVRGVEYDCGSRFVVAWHASPEAAANAARQLQAEFDLARKIAGPWYEVVDTIFDMYQQESLDRAFCEAAQALIEQLKEWWHAEQSAWQSFVEDEVLSRMSDPPRYARELVAVDAAVNYEVRPIRRGAVVVEGQGRLAAWASGHPRGGSTCDLRSPRQRRFHMLDQPAATDQDDRSMTIEDILKEAGMPSEQLPPAPSWHIDASVCQYGWIEYGVEPAWLLCNCEDPANPWPPRSPGDGPRDCRCFACEGHEPRWERGKLKDCEYKDHHCDYCHTKGLCTIAACGFRSA